jgi:hypothetical protein
MKRTCSRLVPVLLAAAWLAPALSAQYTNSYGYTFNNPVSAMANTIVWNRMNARLMYQAMLKKKGYTDAQLSKLTTKQMLARLGVEGGAAEVQKSRPGAATKFRMAESYVLLPDLAKNLTADPGQQKALVQVFDQGVQAYEKDAAADGFGRDVAGAMTFLIASAYYVYRGGEEPDEKGTTFIGRAIQQNLESEEFRRIADLDKQKFYEFMIGMGTYLILAYKQAAEGGDARVVDQIKAYSGDALKSYLKLDPAAIRITANGLEGTAAR